MPSQENFFVVRTGLGVGTQALFADAVNKTVSIGKTQADANIVLDVVGNIASSDVILAGNKLGVNLAGLPTFELDVLGTGYITNSLGINDDPGANRLKINTTGSESVVVTGVGSVGIGSTLPKFHLDVLNNARISGFTTLSRTFIGFATITNAVIYTENVGVSTVGFSSVTAEFVGISTIIKAFISDEEVTLSQIGSAIISNETVGISTIQFANIIQETVGLSTVGISSIANAFVGILTVQTATITDETVDTSSINIGSINTAVIIDATVGFASITNLIVGVSTISQEKVGISTIETLQVGVGSISNVRIGIATITTEFVTTSEINNLLVTGITTTANLDVGIGGTIITATRFVPEQVFGTIGTDFVKTIQPLVAIGTDFATRTLDIAGDVRIRGEVVDSSNNVGFAYSVLASAYNIPGRFIDASNLLVRNREFIAHEIVGFITSTDGPFGVYGPDFDYGVAGIVTGRLKCKRDIGLVIDAIAFDISKGGNSKSVGAGLSYYSGVTLQYLDDSLIIPVGFSSGYVKRATLVGFSSISNLARFVINNSILPKSYQIGISSIPQVVDIEVLADGDSNANPNACANVVSAIHTCVGIVTTIIGTGSTFAPKINNPVGELVWQPPGAIVGNVWFVAKYGNDSNLGESPGDAFLTIKKACSIALPGDTVKVFAGLYVEEGPIQVPERVAVVGEDLRRTLVTTRGQTDLYHVRRGCYIAQQSFIGPLNPNAMVSFPTQGLGYADGTEKSWQSPYVQNCTNFVPNSVGLRIDGNRAGGFKSIVLDAYTQYNQGGIGVSITNFGYAQLVSLFTICCDIAVYNDTGGVCDMNNSNASFGNFGLVADGATPLQYIGIVTSLPTGDNIDTLILNVGAGKTQADLDAVDLLRENANFLANEVVGFVTSTSGPYGANGPLFDYGGAPNGREKCKRDTKIIIESFALDILLKSNINAIETSLAYRDSSNYLITYLDDSSPLPVGFNTGYVAFGEAAAITHLAGISTFIIQNQNLPNSFQSGVSSIRQFKDGSKNGYTTQIRNLISSNAGIITSVIGIGTGSIPARILPKGQRPYDGQVSFIDTQFFTIDTIRIDNPGFGYEFGAPVEVQIGIPDLGEDGLAAEVTIFEDGVAPNGTIIEASILVSGTGYLSPPTVTIAPPPTVGVGVGTIATATAVMEKLFFNVVSSTQVDPTGITTVTFDQFITYPVGLGSTVAFFQASKIIASGITFEYIGTGVDIVNSVPSKGAVSIQENETVARNGGRVPFTSTDQGGNFRISEGISINQNTGTISGTAFSKSLQSEVTPLIIALGGN